MRYIVNENLLKAEENYRHVDYVRKHINFKLVNYERNKEFLKTVPHRVILEDFAAYYQLHVGYYEKKIATVTITNDHMAEFDRVLTEEDMYEMAMVNAEKNYKETSLAVAAGAFYLGDPEEDLFRVVTNTNKTNGAASLLVWIKNHPNDRVVIVPSSIHEVILFPANKAEGLSEMVRDVNTGIRSKEILGDKAYIYENGQVKAA